MSKLSITVLLGVAVFVLAEPNPPRNFLSTFDECDTECFEDLLRYGYTEGYAKYSCCFSYRLQLTKVALSSRSAANLDRVNLVCDRDCYTEYYENGYSEEMSVNKCCYSNEGENGNVYRSRPHHFGGAFSGSGIRHSSSRGTISLNGWQIGFIAGLAIITVGGGIYATYRKSAHDRIMNLTKRPNH